jgi:hypothetical protein
LIALNLDTTSQKAIAVIEVTAIAFWEVVSKFNAINHVLLIREHG